MDPIRLMVEFQRNEITEYHVYMWLSKRAKGRNREILEKIAKDELRHYNILKEYTGKEVRPSRFRIYLYTLLSLLFGITFSIKLMERSEEIAQEGYELLKRELPQANQLIKEEEEHERELAELIEEERVEYVGSMVLGLNDALVELTGALAGLTFALQNSILIGVAGLITGIAASLSMASSEYLSRRSEGEKNPVRAAIYTGLAYIVTVLLLVAPFFALGRPFASMVVMLLVGIAIIGLFSFFVSVVKDQPMRRMFLEMVTMSLGVAVISFLVGWAVRAALSIEI